MARYSSPRSPRPAGAPASRSRRAGGQPGDDPMAQQLPLVSGKWLLLWLLAIFGGGLALVYLTLCLLFWQGQWQILFHRTQPVMSAAASIPGFREQVLFDTSESGQPRLSGVFLTPADSRSGRTVLYLPDTSTAAFEKTKQDLSALTTTNFRSFTFNYRGMVTGQPDHPSGATSSEDTEAAWQFLTSTRHIPPAAIVIYGTGLGAALAAQLAARHPEAAGLVMDEPSLPALDLFRADPRSHWMPVRLLTHDRFDPADSIATAPQPKLLLLPADADPVLRHYAQVAKAPKLIVDLPGAPSAGTAKQEALKRFLDELPPALERK